MRSNDYRLCVASPLRIRAGWHLDREPSGCDGESQMIYVDPRHRLIIVKSSANRDFQRNGFESTRETLALWRTVAADLDGDPRQSP